MGILRRVENGTTTERDAITIKRMGISTLIVGIGIGSLIVVVIMTIFGTWKLFLDSCGVQFVLEWETSRKIAKESGIAELVDILNRRRDIWVRWKIKQNSTMKN